MKTCLSTRLILSGLLALTLLPTARAHMTSGGNCANCHTPATSRTSLTTTGTLTLSARLDGNPQLTLPSFDVTPGGSVSITLSVIDGGANGDQFAFAFTGKNTGAGASAVETLNTGSTTITAVSGVKTSLSNKLVLSLSTGAGWTRRTTGSVSYYTQGLLTWAGTTTSRV
jgi:hypothetical protein